jgi:PAS domain S-box-containing protein
MTEIELLKRRLEREMAARKQAEAILEEKALDLYKANENLKRLNDDLEQRVEQRTLELTRSEEKYRGIIENMDLGILEVDNEERIVRAYSRFAALTGYSPEELIGKNALDVFLPDEQKRLMDNQRSKRLEGEPGVYEVQIRRKDGELIWVIISGAPVLDMNGDVVGSIGVHLDITERKKLEQELSVAKHRAEEAQMAEKQFLANMSHEIRTPLNAIIGMAHLLYDTRPTAQQIDFLNALKSSADLLHSLISDILDFSKIETGNIEVRENPFDLIGLVRTIQKTFQIKSKDKPVKVEAFMDAAIHSTVVGDEMLLNQILINLLGNAEKFTEKGKFGIRASVLEEAFDFQTIEFEVYDTGVGMSEEQLPLIFQNFKQLDNEMKQKHKGTGLGLAITKRLIELQGGTIEVDSRVGKGTTFTFSITYKISNDKPSVNSANAFSNNNFDDEKPMEASALSGRHVLIAEDNLMNQKYLTNLLKKWNVTYVIANNGREAINCANKEQFDLIFMDIQMPILDGYEATIHIRNTKNINTNTPIIALTASAILDQKNKAFEIGMNDYISKPFGPTQIQGAFSKFLQPIEKMEKVEEEAMFAFNFRLDVDYLTQFYEGDTEHASEMFELFLTENVKEFYDLSTDLNEEKWINVKQKVHKLKPVFAMVGLTVVGKKIEELEDFLLQKVEKQVIMDLYHQIEKDLNLFLPILEEDLKRMKKWN